MKNKNRILLFAGAFLFLSIFFVGFDGTKNVAKADCTDTYNDCTLDEDTCYNNWMSCSDSAVITSDTGSIPVGSDEYECEYGYVLSGTTCIPADACPVGYTLVNGDCVNEQSQSSQCDYGYAWDGKNCVATDSCPAGYGYVNGQCVDTTGATTDSACDPSPSCWFYNCCSSGSSDTTPDAAPVKTPAEIAAEKAINDANKLAANSASAKQVNAIKQVNAANAALASCGGDVAKCNAAQEAVNKANADLLAANAIADAAIAAYNASNATVNPATVNTGAGFRLCANGAMAMVCDEGGGTPIVLGLNTGGYPNGGGLPVSYGGGSGGVQAPKCEAGFQDIGGICFPMNTGLSSTPIYVIVSNIFSWLMGLFTTLAVLAFVISGVQYFMSSGDESMAEKAKENATNAIIGIVVGLSGFIIIKAIAAALSGQSMFF